MIRQFTLAGALALVLTAVPAIAGEQENEAARKAYQALKDVEKKAQTAADAFSATQKGDDADAKAGARAAYVKVRNERAASRAAFRNAFTPTDWNSWNVDADKELLESGLYAVVTNGGAESESRLKAGEQMLARLPDSKWCKGAVQYRMVGALASNDDLGRAIERARGLMEGADETYRRSIGIMLGDMQCATGDTTAALATYNGVLDAIPKDTDDRSAKSARRYAGLRANLVGKTAPEIDTETWLGADAQPLSALQGKVVVLDFWATWCPPCRKVMPGLDDFYAEKKDAGLVVIGVTRFYKNGFIPNGPDTPSKGERMTVEEAKYEEHLQQFKDAMEISYPFAVGTQEHFKAYRVSGIPTLVVIGRDGRVAYATVGGGNEKLLHRVVNRQLEAPVGSPPADKDPNAQ